MDWSWYREYHNEADIQRIPPKAYRSLAIGKMVSIYIDCMRSNTDASYFKS